RTARPGHDELTKLLWPNIIRRDPALASRPPFTLEERMASKAWIVGTPEQARDILREMQEVLGLEALVIFPHLPGMRRQETLEQLGRFWADVRPALTASIPPRPPLVAGDTLADRTAAHAPCATRGSVPEVLRKPVPGRGQATGGDLARKGGVMATQSCVLRGGRVLRTGATRPERLDMVIGPDGRIVTLTPTAPVLPGAQDIALMGRLVTPGLIDAHQHLDKARTRR